ncbi:MAG: hydroxymethylglutaryl-CoA lyase [Firmicutes bacterium]|nr:hydroxymethylglutaryl-CoA lyase [Bacillota bacterium]
MKFKDKEILITDVTARDGFQMEKAWIPTATKIDIINKIIATGVKRIEAAAFVSPKKVPQMRDAEEVVRKIEKRKGLRTAALVANYKGVKRALAAGVDEIQAVLSVSETHNVANIDRDIKTSINEIGEMADLAKQHGKIFNVSLSTVFGCSYEGLIPVEKTAIVIEALARCEIANFVLSDTNGMANPRQIYEYSTKLQKEFPQLKFGLHFHNARGMGLANALAGYEAGIERFDSAVGGIGGCPFTLNAAGNVCTEDLVFMFQEMGLKTGIDVPKLIKLAQKIEALFGRTLPGYMMKTAESSECD